MSKDDWGARLQGRCPSCHNDTLFRGHSGYITCSLLGCKNPGAAHDLLSAAVSEGAPADPPGTLLAAERRIASLCDAHEEAFLRAEAAESRLAALRAALEQVNTDVEKFAVDGLQTTQYKRGFSMARAKCLDRLRALLQTLKD